VRYRTVSEGATMTQDARQEPMSTSEQQQGEQVPQAAAPTHARRIDCGGTGAAAPVPHPGRAPRPGNGAAGAGRRTPRR
jgi:hypothetical protein